MPDSHYESTHGTFTVKKDILWLYLCASPWYVPNAVIKRHLQVLTVRQEVRNYSVTYR